ncbi:hypothetical protein HC928_22610 [bacterium]|nr:hypothetical protein [bacterium]
MEMAQPWRQELWLEHPIVGEIFKVTEKLRKFQGIFVRPLLIAPDREYSRPGLVRILYYYRPAKLFAEFQKQEFLIPPEQIYSLAIALLQQPEQLIQFEQYQQATSHLRELMVCTHGNIDIACARLGNPIYENCVKLW